MDYAKLKDSISWIHPLKIQCGQRVNDSWSCIFSNLGSDWFLLLIKVAFAAFIGKRECETLPAEC
jgi:hypothetical protein